ncbi:hypothetical protein [Gallaecimonas sp. GXIMD1310]|uniref:hypothetical protein n=1 Tax=Gallaecimonas sp. GXIMD1310 TaxID=3131926 RepID=UPI003250F2F4
MNPIKFVSSLASVLAPVVAFAASPDQLHIISKVSQFEHFYHQATAKPLTEPQRWQLWQKQYGIAAVPPGPAGQKLARKYLRSAWPRYSALLPKLPALNTRLIALGKKMFAADNRILGSAGQPIDTDLLLYVGLFTGNAYTAPPSNQRPPMVVMPVQHSYPEITLAHELAHSIHEQLAHIQSSFGGPLGETVFMEGIAMHTAKLAAPGYSDNLYTSRGGNQWLQQCYQHKNALLKAMLPDLQKAGPALAMKYTYGNGNTHMHRETYCAGWVVVGDMMKTRSLAKLARIPQAKIAQTVSHFVASHYPS